MKDPRVYLAHILECVQKIEDYTRSGRAAFLAEPMTQDAVIRNFELIGEAAKRVDAVYREKHPQFPWTKMAGFRDVLIHNYEELDLEIVWATVERDIPTLRQGLLQLLPPLDQIERELATDDDGSPDK